MFQVIGIIVVLYFCIKFSDKIKSYWKTNNDTENSLLIFSLHSILSSLTDRQRILIRDNIDGVFDSYGKNNTGNAIDHLVMIQLIPLTYLSTIQDPETKEAITKLFNLLSSTFSDAPSSYKENLTVSELHAFIKDKI